MLTLQRQNEILQYLREQKSASIKELSEKFFIGEATIRRDLDKLEQRHLINRTYGGAVLLEGINAEIPISVREREQSIAKDYIGKLAASFVSDGDIVILDSSTTTYAMIPYLKGKKNLTVITNGIKTASTLGETLHTTVYCTGGKLRENSLSLVGQAAREFISNINAQKLFFSCRAISLSGTAMDSSEEEAELRKLMLQHCGTAYLLCDGSKLGASAFYKICEHNAFTGMITDAVPPDGIAAELRDKIISE